MNKIVTIGIKIADLQNIKFDSLESLSAYDTIIFRPQCNTLDMNQNLILLYVQHWFEELNKAHQKHKNIILFLPLNTWYHPKDSADIDLSNCFPFRFEKRPTNGKDIEVSSKSFLKDIFKDFCLTFQDVLKYEYIFRYSDINAAVLINKDNDMVAQYFADGQGGNVVILQNIDDDFLLEPKKRLETEQAYQKRLQTFQESYGQISYQLKNFIIKLVKNLSKIDKTFEAIPDWIEEVNVYDTKDEINCASEINKNMIKIAQLNEQNKILNMQRQEASILKSLLYATGSQLEKAVNISLNILGAVSKQYENKKESLEIDNFIKYNGVTFIGEDKGLDTCAMNGDLGQLITNSNQYYELECSSDEEVPLKILFVNSERKKELSTRKKEQCCSDKVLKLLKSNSVLVVWTPDLFWVAKYIKDTNDREFAKRCMECLINKKYGIVDFPKIPKENGKNG